MAGFAVLLLLGLLLAAALVGLTLMWQREMTASRTKPAAAPAASHAASTVPPPDAQADARGAVADKGANAETGAADSTAETEAAASASGLEPPAAPHIDMKDCQWLYDSPLKECARHDDGACKTAEDDFPAAVARGVSALAAKPGFSAGGFHNACLMACITHAKPALSEYSRQVCGIP